MVGVRAKVTPQATTLHICMLKIFRIVTSAESLGVWFPSTIQYREMRLCIRLEWLNPALALRSNDAAAT